MEDEQVIPASDKTSQKESSASVNSVLLAIIVILLLILTAGGAYFFGSTKKMEASPTPISDQVFVEEENVTPIPEETTQGSATPTPTASSTPTPSPFGSINPNFKIITPSIKPLILVSPTP